MARWITVHRPFDYRWHQSAVTAFRQEHVGEHFVKDELADYAVANGHATEGKAKGSKARSTKGKTAANKAATKAASAGEKAPVKTADDGSDGRVAEPDMALHDRPDDRDGVAETSG